MPHVATLHDSIFRDANESFSFNQEILGRVLGPATAKGNEMAPWILKVNGTVVPRHTVWPLNTSGLHSPHVQRQQQLFDRLIERRLGTRTAIRPAKPSSKPKSKEEETDSEELGSEELDGVEPNHEDAVDSNGCLLDQQPAYDKQINAKAQLQHEDTLAVGRVSGRSVGQRPGHMIRTPF